jgi:hypothetical protein
MHKGLKGGFCGSIGVLGNRENFTETMFPYVDIVGVAGSIPAAPTIALAKSCCAFRGRIHLMFWNVRGRRV